MPLQIEERCMFDLKRLLNYAISVCFFHFSHEKISPVCNEYSLHPDEKLCNFSEVCLEENIVNLELPELLVRRLNGDIHVRRWILFMKILWWNLSGGCLGFSWKKHGKSNYQTISIPSLYYKHSFLNKKHFYCTFGTQATDVSFSFVFLF